MRRERYMFLKILGEGSYGKVYSAIDTEKHQEVAIKVVSFSPHDEEEMDIGVYTDLDGIDSEWIEAEIPAIHCRELAMMRKISSLPCSFLFPRFYGYFIEEEESSPNISSEVPMESQALFIVMELMTGKTLDNIVREWKGKVPPDLSYLLVGKMLETLVCLHDHGVKHGDLHERNIIWDGERIKFIDFGMGHFNGIDDICPRDMEEDEILMDDITDLGDIISRLFTGKDPAVTRSGFTKMNFPPSSHLYNKESILSILWEIRYSKSITSRELLELYQSYVP